MAAGVVEKAFSRLGPGFSGHGKVVVIKGGGLWFLYSHLDRVDVRVGQRVRKGQQIGTVGRTCYKRGDPQRQCSFDHVHFEVSPRRYPQPAEAPRLDPVAWLQGAGGGAAGGGLVLLGVGGLGWWLWRRYG